MEPMEVTTDIVRRLVGVARDAIDEEFGTDYAIKNPAFVAAVMSTACEVLKVVDAQLK